MKKFLLLPVVFLTLASVGAQSWTFETFANWEKKPFTITSGVPALDLAYLNGVYKVLGTKDFSFLYRKDRHHWVGLSRISNQMILHIHDSTKLFNFRGVVNRSTGVIYLHHGIQYKAKTATLSANHSAELALGYVTKLRKGTELFPGSLNFSSAPVVTSSAPVAHSSLGIEKLMEGNARFVKGKPLHPNQTTARRTEVAAGQKPFAAILTCSDSRVPPEVVFDQGLGDLFVVRTAGEVATAVELGSLEYAVEHLGVTQIVVLGHERCGAVDSAVKGGHAPANIQAILDLIAPAVTRARTLPGNLMDNAVDENVKEVLATLKKSTVLAQSIEKGHLKVAGAVVDLDTGLVEVLK